MRKKPGFTLVEMLIVVIIIGILTSTILPRITGAQEKARDTKRQADLQNIAAGIETYTMNRGEFPFYSGGVVTNCSDAGFFFRSAKDLEEPLSPYLKGIPRDPIRSSQIDICTNSNNARTKCQSLVGKGNYLYTIQKEAPNINNLESGKPIVLLIAKVETPDAANFVLISHEGKQGQTQYGFSFGGEECPLLTFNPSEETDSSPSRGGLFSVAASTKSPRRSTNTRGCFGSSLTSCGKIGKGNQPIQQRKILPGYIGPKLNLCNTIEKGKTATQREENGEIICTYSSEDQLYYIVKIE